MGSPYIYYNQGGGKKVNILKSRSGQINYLKAVIDQLNDIAEQQGAIIEYVNQNMGAENVE